MLNKTNFLGISFFTIVPRTFNLGGLTCQNVSIKKTLRTSVYSSIFIETEHKRVSVHTR